MRAMISTIRKWLNGFGYYERKWINGRRVFLRKNSIDSEVFEYVFDKKYHLPAWPLPAEAIVIDLGVNIGLTVVDFKILCPASQVIGFEMDKSNFELAKKNTNGLPNVQLFNKAVWYEKTILSYSKKNNADAFFLDDGSIFNEDRVEVETISIPEIIEQNKLNHIDFVKMDIEGAEQEIFTHGTQWLKKVDQIKIEVHKGEESMEYIRARLVESGFKVMKDTMHWSTLVAIKQ